MLKNENHISLIKRCPSFYSYQCWISNDDLNSFLFEFEFRKHRTIKGDVIDLSRFVASANIEN
jgi:hypothetical protein